MDQTIMERIWDDHNAAEFASKDAELAMRTMVDEPYVRILANGAGGKGGEQVRRFYADVLIPGWPADGEIEPRNRVVGSNHLVDELHLRFTHGKQMDWLVPGAPASDHKVEMDVVIVAEFREGLIAEERIYWDHAAVLQQVGLLKL
jgi:carboxymethylenebutenolidase